MGFAVWGGEDFGAGSPGAWDGAGGVAVLGEVEGEGWGVGVGGDGGVGVGDGDGVVPGVAWGVDGVEEGGEVVAGDGVLVGVEGRPVGGWGEWGEGGAGVWGGEDEECGDGAEHGKNS